MIELVKQIADLQRQVDGLIKPEVPLGMSLISETVLSASAASIAFSSISDRFRHLILFTWARGDDAGAADEILLRFNGDSAGNYDWQQVFVSSTSITALASRAATSSRSTTSEGGGSFADTFSPGVMFIINYADATAQKAFVTLSGRSGDLSANTQLALFARYGHWRSTAAITSITLIPSIGANFVSGSKFSLYGVL